MVEDRFALFGGPLARDRGELNSFHRNSNRQGLLRPGARLAYSQ
jgi:hypothetical protein